MPCRGILGVLRMGDSIAARGVAMADSEQLRGVVNDVLRHVGPQRVITAAAITTNARQRLGRDVTTDEVAAVLAAYAQQGKVRLETPSGGTPTVVSISKEFLEQLQAAMRMERAGPDDRPQEIASTTSDELMPDGPCVTGEYPLSTNGVRARQGQPQGGT